MEDFEYSVEICDRDWDCFFKECEECSLLPPSIAGVDDSGMSDIDDTRSIFAKRAQRIDLKGSHSGADRTIDGPPDCEGSPVENYLSRHGVSGMESVLSGSEEDIHLQSVNMFFERMKNGAEVESLTEPSKVRDSENMEEEKCSDQQKDSSSILQKSCPKSISLPARGETAVGKDMMEPVNTISDIMKTLKKDELSSSVIAEPAARNSVRKTNTPAQLETKFFIREEAGTITRINEAKQWNWSHTPPEGVKSAGSTPHVKKENKVGKFMTQEDAKKEQLKTGHSQCSTELWNNLEMLTNVKWKKDQNTTALYPDATSSGRTVSHESSPSASLKRKRRKKRRLSIEPPESVHGCDRQVLVKQSDSEEEQHARTGGMGLCLSGDNNLAHISHPQKSVTPSLMTYSAPSNFPVMLSKVHELSHHSHPYDCPYQYLQDSLVGHTSYFENTAPNNRSVTQESPMNNGVMSEQNNNGNVKMILQPCSQLQKYDSVGLHKYSGLPVSSIDFVSGKSAHSESLCPADDIKHARIYCNNKEYNPVSSTAEVKAITKDNSPCTESSDLTVEVSQNDKVSAAKSMLAVEVGIFGRTQHALHEREAEPQQQLETDCHYVGQYSSTLGKTQFPLNAICTSSSDTRDTNPKPIINSACPSAEELSNQVDCVGLPLDASDSLPGKCCQLKFKSLPSSDKHLSDKQTKHSLLPQILPKAVFSSERDKAAERSELATSQMVAFPNRNSVSSGEMNQTGINPKETKCSMTTDLCTGPSPTPLSSLHSLDTESLVSLPNGNIIDKTGNSGLSLNHNYPGQGEKTALLLTNHSEKDEACTAKSEPVSEDATDLKCDLVVEDEDSVTLKEDHKPEKTTESKPSVFAMSSFWSEMEKLTINDILGLRMTNSSAPSSSLPPLQECEEIETVSMRDSGFFTQPDESKPDQTNEDTFCEINTAESSSGSVIAGNFSSSKSVMWDNEPVALSSGAAFYPKNMIVTSAADISQPSILPGKAQTCLRKISKNISVHHLPALESESYSNSLKGQSLRVLDEGEFDNFTDGRISEQDKDCFAPSLTDSYRLSVTDIFQYLFGGEKSIPSHSNTDIITSHYTDGSSVPETYDHFFSEFDTESFFYPLIEEEMTKEELVPIFSCSRSANRNLQFPEAYEHFFASSSSDDSSDEEDSCSPVRVVTRFNRTSSKSKICTDIYDNFFTDSDLKQNFFWKNTLSLRKVFFSESTVKKQTISNHLSPPPLKPSVRSFGRKVHPINVLGNQDMTFADPLLYHLEDRLSRQLSQQSFRYEDLQTAVANPRLDAPLLPLKHSDMCLLCIAFASWVLKTTNPQVGDAWKAVLLANVSALSAIRYLRKYVTMEAAASEKELQYTSPSEH